MIFHKTNNKDLITYMTFITVDEKLIRLSYSRLIHYLKPKQISNPEFADIFLFRKEAYTNEEVEMNGKMIKLNHCMYHWIQKTNYSKETNIWHELQWDEIKTQNKGYYLIISDSKRNYTTAIPPSSEIRYDYITVDGKYHYGCNKNEFKGIEIISNNPNC